MEIHCHDDNEGDADRPMQGISAMQTRCNSSENSNNFLTKANLQRASAYFLQKIEFW
jgi:hypothetical protein